MDRYVSIGEASEALGVSITTLRRWEVEGKLIPERTASTHRPRLRQWEKGGYAANTPRRYATGCMYQ
jgi:predicted site-specific integrase-resolvase